MSGPHGLADRAQGERRCRGDLRRQRMRLGAHSVAGDQAVAEPDGRGLFPFDPSSGEQQIEGVLLADDGGQGDRQAEDVVEPEAGEVGGEPCLRAADPEVGQARQAEAGADGGALDAATTGVLAPNSRAASRYIRSGPYRTGHRSATSGKIGPGAEMLAFGAQQDGPAVSQLVECVVGITQ